MRKFDHQDWLMFTLGVVILCTPVFLLVDAVISKHRLYAERIADVEPKFSRLLGLAGSQQKLDEALNASEHQLDLYAYRAGQDASQAGNDAQQRLRNLFSQAKLDVVSSQVLPAKAEKTFDRIPLSLRLEGDLIGLQSALSVLPTQTPLILIDGMNIQTVGAVFADRPQRLSIQINFSVLRMKP